MTQGDKIRKMNNQELAEEIFRWHEELFGTTYRFVDDVKDFLDKECEEDTEEVM